MVSVLYESPHALSKTLMLLREVCGAQRHIVVAKELTKMHEHVFRGCISEAINEFGADIKGEFVLIIYPDTKQREVSDEDIKELLREYKASRMTKKDAAKAASEKLGIRPNRAYRLTI